MAGVREDGVHECPNLGQETDRDLLVHDADEVLARLAVVVADELYRLYMQEGVRPRDFVKHLEALAAKNTGGGI